MTVQAQILDLIASLQDRSGMGTIMITHDLGVVAQVATRVAVMYAGRIVEIGTAQVVRKGGDITLVAYGAMMRPTLEAVEDLTEMHGVDPEVIDLLSIWPMDTDTLVQSVSKTGRCVIVHEGPRTCGIAAEIIARLNENAFERLLAPIKRVTGYDIHFPFFQVEEHYLPDAESIIEAVKETLAYE